MTGYTDFSEDSEEQEGHFIAIHAECPRAEVTVSVSDSETAVQELEGGIFIARIESTEQSVTVTANGGLSGAIIKEYSLEDLTLASEL